MASRKKEESEKAIRLCGKQCVICGWNSKSLRGFTLVEGAHVKPVSELDSDCFDDIIALCPNHHAEFDAYDGSYPFIGFEVGEIRKMPAIMDLKLRIMENEDDELAGCMILPKKKIIGFKIDHLNELIKAIKAE